LYSWDAERLSVRFRRFDGTILQENAMLTRVPQSELDNHAVVSQEEWIEASAKLLTLEKELTRRREEISRLRRELPWVRVGKEYVFDGPNGRETLADLFDGRSQLIIYHFMFAPDWDEGCHGCSFIADHIDCANLHLPHNDVTLAVVSHAPFEVIKPYQQRMGWEFKWLSAYGSDFNRDFGVSFERAELDAGEVLFNYSMQKIQGEEQPGVSVFYKNGAGEILHTYSSYERGLDVLLGAHAYLDLTPKGRNEESPMDWVERHDRY
jgi:predicted dithiol-disulfide oxidoreductase (DUF899 family)